MRRKEEYIIPRKNNKDAYIYKRGDKYVIYKKVPHSNGNKYFGTFNDKESARKYKEFLEKHNWDTKYIKRHRKKWTPAEDVDHKYITFNMSVNKWVVHYYKEGKHYHLGCFDSFEEAREERDFWRNLDWNLELLDLY